MKNIDWQCRQIIDPTNQLRDSEAGFIYFAANRDNAVNHILITSIVLNSILTAFDFVNVPNSDIAIF